MYIAGVINLCS